jgi:hypothetical protein
MMDTSGRRALGQRRNVGAQLAPVKLNPIITTSRPSLGLPRHRPPKEMCTFSFSEAETT